MLLSLGMHKSEEAAYKYVTMSEWQFVYIPIVVTRYNWNDVISRRERNI